MRTSLSFSFSISIFFLYFFLFSFSFSFLFLFLIFFFFSWNKLLKSYWKRHEREFLLLLHGQIKFFQWDTNSISTVTWGGVVRCANMYVGKGPHCWFAESTLWSLLKPASVLSWWDGWLLCKHLLLVKFSAEGMGFLALAAPPIIQQMHSTEGYPDWCNRRVTSL